MTKSPVNVSAADYLAHEIEWVHARDRAELKRPRRHGSLGRLTKEARRMAISAEFDPHAATELAALIEHRMRGPRGKAQ